MDRQVRNANIAAWVSAIVSVIALYLSYHAYRQSIQLDPMSIRFKFVSMEVKDKPKTKRFLDAIGNHALVDNQVRELEGALAATSMLGKLNLSDDTEFSFLLVENLSPTYIESMKIHSHLRTVEKSSNEYSKNEPDVTHEIRGIAHGEFVIFPTSLGTPLDYSSLNFDLVELEPFRLDVTDSDGGKMSFEISAENQTTVDWFFTLK